MKRALVLGVLIAVGGLVTLKAQPDPNAPKVVEVEKVKDNLFVLRGANGGGNTAVFVMANGVAVVDSKNPGWGQPILAKIKELTPKPVTLLINTHTHGDHVSGNVAFAPSVDVVVQENTKTNMEKMPIFKENNNNGMAKRTFKDRMTIGKGADQIDLYYFGRGHTNGDAWIVFPAHRIVHSGDIFAGKSVPLIDGNNGGSMREMPETLQEGARGTQERRSDHQRSHAGADNDGRSQGVRAVQRGPGGVWARRAQGGQDARAAGCRMEASGEVQGLLVAGERDDGRPGRTIPVATEGNSVAPVSSRTETRVFQIS